MAEPFSFKKDWGRVEADHVRDHLAECGCRPPGHQQPRYVLLSDTERRRGVWVCPHQKECC
jgi:hypothetical protein